MNTTRYSAPVDAYARQLAKAPAPQPQASFRAVLRELVPEPGDARDSTANLAWRERAASDELAKARGIAPHGILLPLPSISTRAMSVAGVAGSNYLVNDDTAPGAVFVDGLRDASLLSVLPIQEVGPLVGTALFPRIASGDPAVWLADEDANTPMPDITFGALIATPKVVGSLMAMSWQFRRQLTPATEAYILRELAAGIAEGLDAAIIEGSGVGGEPQGVLNTSGVGNQTGTSLAWAGILAMLETVEASKAIRDRSALAWLASPDVAELLRARQRFTGSSTAIVEAERIAGYPMIVHSAVPAGTLILGDWSRLWLAHWGSLDLAGSESDGTDFRTGITKLRGMLWCDVVVSAPSAFCKAEGVT